MEVGAELDINTYERLVKRFLAKNTLAHRTGEARLNLPLQYHDWAVGRARELIGGVQATGVQVVGDLEELVPAEPDGVTKTDISEPEVTEAAVHALEALVLRLAGVPRRPESADRSEG